MEKTPNAMTVTTPIIPERPIITPHMPSGVIHREAVCIFSAIGFFLEKDAWYTGQTALQPAMHYDIDDQGHIQSEKSLWQWHYNPRDLSLKQATEEFAHLFERIAQEQTKGKKVILPLSGGLDSRTLAAVLGNRADVSAFTYEFPGGIPETCYGKSIARAMGFDFQGFTIPESYLWGVIEKLAQINGCYAEFTHPRSMALLEAYPRMGDVFFLGHWGDVLFDDMGVADEMPFEQQVETVIKKVVKKGGMELGNSLWEAWGLDGNFKDYLRSRIESLLRAIQIENANARIRAFKSLYWAARWTSANMGVFSSVHPIALPYYQNDMCKFICTVPEHHLAGRRIQIEYLKTKAPELAKIRWQAHRPFNLYTYHWDKLPWNLLPRILQKGNFIANKIKGKPIIQRNWEIQFLGNNNDKELHKYLFKNEKFNHLVPGNIVQSFYQKFKTDSPVYFSHPISMLLTFSLFTKLNT